LFTPIRLFGVACYAAGPLKVRLSFRSQNVPPPPPKPLHKHRHICSHLVTAHFSQMTNRISVSDTACFDYCCSGVHCGLKYQQWPMIQKLFLDQKGCQWRTVPIYKSDKSNAQKSEIQISMFTATGRPTDLPLIVLG
jgi:hypothetical protein